MYSRPFLLVHCVLQLTVQVWHPMHLLRSMTIAICRFDMFSDLALSSPSSSSSDLLVAVRACSPAPLSSSRSRSRRGRARLDRFAFGASQADVV
jgi:hypothetical protein